MQDTYLLPSYLPSIYLTDELKPAPEPEPEVAAFFHGSFFVIFDFSPRLGLDLGLGLCWWFFPFRILTQKLKPVISSSDTLSPFVPTTLPISQAPPVSILLTPNLTFISCHQSSPPPPPLKVQPIHRRKPLRSHRPTSPTHLCPYAITLGAAPALSAPPTVSQTDLTGSLR
jgi:hypothetical protein